MGSEKVRRGSTTIKLNQLKTTVVLAFLAFVLVVVFAASFSRSHRAEGDFRPIPSLKFKSESADVHSHIYTHARTHARTHTRMHACTRTPHAHAHHTHVYT